VQRKSSIATSYAQINKLPSLKLVTNNISYICISINSSRSSQKQMDTIHFSFIIHGWDGTHGSNISIHIQRGQDYRNNFFWKISIAYKLHELIHIRLSKSQTFQDICVCVRCRAGQEHEPKCGYREENFSFNLITAFVNENKSNISCKYRESMEECLTPALRIVWYS
jgi:hypothetical protein